jgi:predicted GIY-YIG superfamily endonuclease
VPFVYLLRCGDGSLYAGSAMDLQQRLARHQSGKGGAYTRSHLPVALAWSRRVRSWSAALKAERRIKQLKKAEKEALVAEFCKK